MSKQIKQYILRTLKNIKTHIQDILARGQEYLSHCGEIKKFQDPRRVAIWSNVHLSEEQKEQIDQFYLKNYGKKVAHTWHRHYTAFTEFNQRYTHHPDTHITFKGYHIPHMSKLIETAEHMHAFLPQCGIYNWDFTINKEGVPVLIEANTGGGSIWLAQEAHGKGIFGDNTADILQWIAFMKKLSPSKRKLYKPGYTTYS